MIQLLLSLTNQDTTTNLILLIILLHLLSSIFSICSSNPMHSLMFLILSFFSLSLLFLVVGLEFLSLLVLLIYVGSICILFVFVLMILDLKILTLKSYLRYKLYFISIFVISFIVLLLFILEFQISVFFIHSNDSNVYIYWPSLIFNLSNLEVMGQIFIKYTFHFVIAAVLLFSVMIGSISIVSQTRKQSFKLNYLTTNESDFLRSNFNELKLQKKINQIN